MRMLQQVLLLLCLLAGLPAAAGQLTVEMLDVGQGDGILISTPGGKHVLIDAAVKRADVLGQLRARGIDKLDLVVATHPHADHIGGMEEVLRGLPVGFYTDNGLPHTTQTYRGVMDAVEELGLRYRPARRDQSFSLDDGAKLTVLFPTESALRGTRSDLNANSVVLRLDHGDNCFLFTGDSEEPTELALLRSGLEPCAVLKVAHHGSSHSTTAAWLRTVQPTIALVSAGVGNRYGHPDPEALERLESAGAEIYRTDLVGAIVITSDGSTLSVETRGKDAAPAVASATGPRDHQELPARPGAPTTKDQARAALQEEQVATQDQVTAAVAAATQAASAATGCVYVASRNSKLYHPAACHVVDRIYEANRLCFDSAEAAQASGRRRSASCPELGP